MFLDNSRYHNQPTAESVGANGRSIVALKLRKLPGPAGKPHIVKEHDRLDVLAQAKYEDGAKFWHIADANTALQAGDLTAEPGTSIQLPDA